MACRTTVTALINGVSRLAVTPGAASRPVAVKASDHCLRCIHTQPSPLLFHASSQLWGAPMKKKKKVDPAVLLARENKRKKKIEKQMKRLEKYGRRFKPIEEIEGDLKLRRELQMRKRPAAALSFEESEGRALLHKDWARVRMRQHKWESVAWTLALSAQNTALEQLRAESEELYQLAIQRDDSLIPLEFRGPTATPPIKDYMAPDGEYIDVTKTYD